MTSGSLTPDAPPSAPTGGGPDTGPATIGGRLDDLVLAGVHLRLGSLALARAELEALAGRDALDEGGLVDLAEARWRTGDLIGAGEAAQAALDGETGPVIALLIAAEAAAARGRPTEARRFAVSAMAGAGGSIDRIFAGMPRSAVWPADPAAPPPSPTTMFHAAPGAGRAASGRVRAGDAAMASGAVAGAAGAGSAAAAAAAGGSMAVGASAMSGTPDGGPADQTGAADGTVGVAAAGTAGFWDLPAEEIAGDASDHALPSAEDELAGGRSALESGDTHEAAVRLALVLRLTPALAPAVLDIVAGRGERELAMVRGDAYRLVGRELDARRAYADAAHPRQEPDAPAAADPTGEPGPQPAPDDPPIDPATTEGDSG